jgi:hypothetical protein
VDDRAGALVTASKGQVLDVVWRYRVVVVKARIHLESSVHLGCVGENDHHDPQMEQNLQQRCKGEELAAVFVEQNGLSDQRRKETMGHPSKFESGPLPCTLTMYRMTIKRAPGNFRRNIPIRMLRESKPCTALPTVA